jgi:SagB-type dehydrogenase family enzyme
VTRLRRSAALVLELEAGAVVGFDYLQRRRSPLSSLQLGALVALADWRPPAALFDGVAERRALSDALVALLDLGFVLAEGSAGAAADERIRREWKWGAAAGFYHFGIKDPDYQPPSAVYHWMAHQVVNEKDVALTEAHEGRDDAVRLTPPRGEPFALMARRRSWRGYHPQAPLPLGALGDCLFAGLGITGFADPGIPGHPPLPMKMTPSGGARNPYEAYVVARAVEGLAPGVYHYSGVDHSLAPLGRRPGSLAKLLGNQEWFDAAGAVVFLVARFERCMWKYPHPTGYRVVVLEAGHIAQNLLLAATAHGLAATPTCALGDRAVEELLGLDRLAEAAVHAVALGVRAAQPSVADTGPVVANPRLARE